MRWYEERGSDEGGCDEQPLSAIAARRSYSVMAATAVRAWLAR